MMLQLGACGEPTLKEVREDAKDMANQFSNYIVIGVPAQANVTVPAPCQASSSDPPDQVTAGPSVDVNPACQSRLQ